MYAIRSYYELPTTIVSASEDRAAAEFVQGVFVITSYSIHYTKLYEQDMERLRAQPLYVS